MWPLIATAFTALLAVKDGIDDAYIVYRYVARWVEGGGLTFNDGEFVEGFTSLAWTLLLGIATWISSADVALTAVVLNYIIILATVIVLDRGLVLASADASARFIVLSIFATSYAYLHVSFFGLELALFGLLLTCFSAVLLAAVRPDLLQGRSITWFASAGVLGGLLFATRPEGLVVLPATLLLLWMLNVTRQLRPIATAFAGYAFIVASVLVWRQLYYGEWLPNSVIAKSLSLTDVGLGQHIERRLIDGLAYLGNAYVTNPALALVVAAAGCLALSRSLSRWAVLLFVPVLWGHVVLVQNGGDWMREYRLVTMYTPLYLLAGYAVVADMGRRFGRQIATLLAVTAIGLHVWSNLRAYRADDHQALSVATRQEPVVTFRPDYVQHAFSHAYVTVGKELNAIWKTGDVLAAESIGTIGYFAPAVYVHDPTGLTDRTLAHDATASQNTFGRMNWRYSMSLNPAVVLVHDWGHQRRWSTYRADYPAEFDRLCVRPTIDPDHAFVLYAIVRKDRPEYTRAIRRVGGRPLVVGRDGDVHCPASKPSQSDGVSASLQTDSPH